MTTEETNKKTENTDKTGNKPTTGALTERKKTH